ncbi:MULTISPECIES: phage integrase central domain-containing protein [unclassified Caballeronia]|uniref:tyrosine-type recombinase/integrase n=1 Tax=unclassified Caballeronia TaxID=2646786 RepID=UPI00285FE8D5|nr:MULTISPECIES: integrase arm-type DNA-binding domain-containing protein [unclassified Caballeronia]MDR5770875.1 tyrosine-type recombinase/integrase [Caballeronia sp. LZ002]MDR5846312.1 tyrosine-type recombinase/integrase [Caballeronia sp. LZ003]
MPRKAKELGPLAVSRLTEPGKYPVGGVDGLYLRVTSPSDRYWILRVVIAGKRREIGLGAYSKTRGVAEARAMALEKREDVKRGIDPIMQRKEAASQLRAGQALEMTFKDTSDRYIAAKEVEWRNSKHGAQWTYTLAEYAHPIIGKMQVRHVTRAHVLEILEPIWQAKTETASRLRGRIEAILDYARVKGFRDEGVNPAAWRGNLDKLLSAPKKTKRVRNHPALPIVQMGAFMTTLRGIEGVSARCLEFSILTAARSGEARAADWSEIDLDKAVWAIPAEKMKAKKEHRVPLPKNAVALLKSIDLGKRMGLVFPSPRSGRALSDMSLLAIMRRQGLEATPHGFRSTFRDWASEYTNYPRELAEVALAHIKGDATEAAYWRSDVLQKRRRLMEDWSAFCDKVIEAGAVIPMNKQAQK